METPEKTEAAQASAPAKQDPATQAAAAKAEAADALIESWIATLRGGAIAQYTPAWNELTSSLPALKAAILQHQGA